MAQAWLDGRGRAYIPAVRVWVWFGFLLDFLSVPESSFGLHPFFYPFLSTLLVCVDESRFGLPPFSIDI
jgi:hypothetical protein